MNAGLMNLITIAKGLNEYGLNEEPNHEYVRGQMELICDLHGLEADVWGGPIIGMILGEVEL